ncbi:MAG: thioredoxin family protein, partial [Phaeodactylibacter sp.]|nr:thioredoxin family protein [Phaeodactylibacter sp.]
MKQIVLSAAFCLLIGVAATAQGTGIAFSHDSWEEVLQQANEANKLIFVDAYAVWCGPCKAMSKDVFTADHVGDFYNENFINVKMDMERGEGVGLAREFNVRAYPTLLYVNGSGEVVHRGVGYHASDELIALGEKALNEDGNLLGMEARYARGDRDAEFLQEYAMLRYGMMDGSHQEVVDEYMETQKNWNTPENMAFIMRFADNKDSKMFDHIADNREAYEELFGKEQVVGKIQQVMVGSIPQNASEEEVFSIVDNIYAKAYPVQGPELSSHFRILYYRQARDVEKFAEAAVQHFNKYPSDDWSELNEMAWTFYEAVENEAYLETAV